MNAVWHLCRRDLVAAFAAPLAWLVLAAWGFLTGMILALTVWSVVGRTADTPLYVGVLSTGFTLLIVLAPALSMSSFAGERQQGTMALLMTTPVGDGALVAGKALAVFLVLVSLIAALTPHLIAVALVSGLAPGQLAAGLLGLVLAAAAAASLGTWISLLVEAPVTAYVLTFGVIVVLVLVGALPADGVFGPLAQGLGLGPRIAPFLAGRIELGCVAYFLALAAAGLVLARSVLTARRLEG